MTQKAIPKEVGNHHSMISCCWGFLNNLCDDCEEKGTWKCVRFQNDPERCLEPAPCEALKRIAEAQKILNDFPDTNCVQFADGSCYAGTKQYETWLARLRVALGE